MSTRRAVLGSILAGGVASLAGCSAAQDAIFGDAVEASASPAGVTDGSLDATGYEHRAVEERPYKRTVEIQGEQRDIVLTNYLVSYGKEIGDFGADAATLLLFTSPTVSVAGQQANPFAGADDREVLRAVLERDGQGGAENVREVGTRTVSTLDTQVEFTQYESTLEIEGQEVAALLHFGRTAHDGDLLFALGGHPKLLDESGNVYTLAESLVHPAEFDGV